MRVTGRHVPVETDAQRVRPAASEVQVLLSDPSLARDLLGWEATVTLEDGIGRTARWVDEHLHLFRTAQYAV